MRGTQYGSVRAVGLHGIIPAYAGNTVPAAAADSRHRDHPRVCGEHKGAFGIQGRHWGSSPRMRGTHHHRRHHRFRWGIIPAYAGNTHATLASPSGLGDHPRVCGEHALFAIANAAPLGSSPRMRGTQGGRVHFIDFVGIIPAYAGNTGRIDEREGGLRDHPRVCGEHKGVITMEYLGTGSSPRMRGTPKEGMYGKAIDGIIPAYAGNTA